MSQRVKSSARELVLLGRLHPKTAIYGRINNYSIVESIFQFNSYLIELINEISTKLFELILLLLRRI